MEKMLRCKIVITIVLGLGSCTTTRYAGIAEDGYRVVVEGANGTSATQMPSACACKVKCLQLNCTTYSVTRSGAGPVECRVSLPPVRRYTWEGHGDSYVVHKSDYILRGQHFYQMKGDSSINFNSANNTCFTEGGQLPVLLNKEIEDEFRGMMSYFGIQKVWVGAYRQRIYDENEKIVGNEPTCWKLANGTDIEAPKLPQNDDHQCFIFDAESAETYDNSIMCGDKFPTICQRDY